MLDHLFVRNSRSCYFVKKLMLRVDRQHRRDTNTEPLIEEAKKAQLDSFDFSKLAGYDGAGMVPNFCPKIVIG